MTNKREFDYKQLSEELDEILASLQSADLDVDEAIQKYEQGMEIAKKLQKYLKEAENKVSKVKTDWNSTAKKDISSDES